LSSQRNSGMILDSDLKTILLEWNLEFKEIKKRILLYGSPERSVFRVGITTTDGSIYMLEKISSDNMERKNQIANHLNQIKNNGWMSLVVPYIQNKKGLFFSYVSDEYWMLTPYIKGIYLNQSTYLMDAWRGNVLADFLVELKKAQSTNFVLEERCSTDSLMEYLLKMEQIMNRYNQKELKLLEKVMLYLKKSILPNASMLPISFCHGDYHCANVVWGKTDIRGVIDWEFCGFKPELYDAANMIGCLGMENPEVFLTEIAKYFIQRLRDSLLFEDISWVHFFDLVLALRFAWLSEWFRKNDTEMVDLEIVYMNLLLDNKEEINKSLGI
jgi:homoserine kinase type II